MAWTPTVNHSRYVALQLATDRVMNTFFRAIPIGPGDGKRIRVNIFYNGSLSVPACGTLLSDTGDNKNVALSAYDKVYPKCFDHDDLRSFEWIPESRVALMNTIRRSIADAVKQLAVTDWVTQLVAGYTHHYDLIATNQNFGLATAAGAADSLAKLGSAVNFVKQECGGDTSSMAIILPIHGTADNQVNLTTQLTTWANNSVGFMAPDGFLRFMGVPIYAIVNTTQGWGGTGGGPTTGPNELAAVVVSNLTPGYCIAPVGGDGYVTSGDWANAIKFRPVEYDASTGMYRMNTHVSFGMGFADEAAVAAVYNP